MKKRVIFVGVLLLLCMMLSICFVSCGEDVAIEVKFSVSGGNVNVSLTNADAPISGYEVTINGETKTYNGKSIAIPIQGLAPGDYEVSVKPISTEITTTAVTTTVTIPVSEFNKVTLQTPQNFKYSTAEGSIRKLVWDVNTQAENYFVEILNASGSYKTETVANAYYIIPSDLPVGNYEIKVKALNSQVGYVESACTAVLPYKVKKLSTPQIYRYDAKTLYWGAIQNAKDYSIKLYNDESILLQTYSTDISSFNIKDIIDKISSEFFYAEIKANGKVDVVTETIAEVAVTYNICYIDSDYSAKEICPKNKLNAPAQASIKADTTTHKLTWNAVDGARGYKIQVFQWINKVLVPVSTIALDSGATVEYSLATFAAGKYEIKISAVGDSVNYEDSDFSEKVDYTTAVTLADPSISLERDGKNWKLVWSAIPNATKYILCNNGAVILETTETEVNLSNFEEPIYNFTIIATTDNTTYMESSPSNTIVVKNLAIPIGLTVENGIIKWVAVESAVDYQIVLSNSAGVTFTINSSVNQVNTNNLASLEIGTYNKISVVARGSSAIIDGKYYIDSKPAIDTSTIKKVGFPKDFKVINTNVGVDFEFNAESGVRSYLIAINDTIDFKACVIDAGKATFHYATPIVVGKSFVVYMKIVTESGSNINVVTMDLFNVSLTKLDAPTNVRVENGILKWNGMAQKAFQISTGIKTIDVAKDVNQYDLMTIEGWFGENFGITIATLGDTSLEVTSDKSTPCNVTKLSVPTIRADKANKKFTWNAITGATKYTVYVDKTTKKDVLPNEELSFAFDTIKAGEFEIMVNAIGNNKDIIDSFRIKESVVYPNGIVPYIHKIEELAQPTNVKFEGNKYITFTNNLDVNEFKYIIVYTSAKTNPTDIAYVNQTSPLKAEVVSGNQKRLDSTVVDLNKIAKLEIIVVGDGFNYINSLPCNVVLGSGTINKLVAPEITQLSNNMLMWKKITDLTHIKDFSLYVDGVLESSAKIAQTATDFNIESIVEKMKAGEHNFQIRANAADASYMSSALSNTYKIVKLNVNGLKMQGNTIVWENFANNQYGYKFIITDKAASEIVLSDVVEGKKGSGIYSHSPKLEIGKQYIVRIQLLGDTSKYFNSDFVELPYKLEKLDTVKSLQLQNGRISWTPDWRANGYTLQMNNMDIDKTFGAEVNIAEEKVIYDKMLDNIKYSFGVKMNGGKVDSGIYYVESDIVSVKKKTDVLVNEVATKLSAPSDLKLNTVGNLIWGSVVDADHYKIYYTDESGVQKLLATDVKGLILTDFSSILSGKVKLKAKAFGIGNNIESVFSNEIEANVLKTPTIKLINKENNIQIKFEQVVDGAGVPIKNYILKINDSVYPLGMADLTNYQTENGVVYYYYDINNADIDKPNTLILLGAEGNSTNIASQMCSIVKEDNIKLGKPQNITITGKYLVWNSVKNATQYRISVLTILDGSYQEVGNTIYTQISAGQQNFDITTLVGNYNQFRLQIVSLNPGVKGYLPSEPAEISSNKTKIDTIKNYVVEGTVLKFDGSNFVKNVRIGIKKGVEPEIEAFYPNSISGKYEIDLAKYLTTGGAYTVTVQMIATDAASNSDVVSITLTVLTMPQPKINELDKDSKIANGLIVWDYDETKTSYNIKITTGTAVRVVRLTFDKAAGFSATNKIYDVKAEVLNTNGTVAETITTTSTFTDKFTVDVRSLINAGVHNIQIMTSITSANVAGSATQNCSSAYIDLGNFTKFADVKNIKASNNKISWDAVVGADVYYIYTINSSSVKTVTTTETQFIFNGTINNVSVPYQIYIVAGKANDTKNILSNNSVLFDLLQLSYPNNVRVENRIAKWDVVEGATGYLFKFGDIETVVNTNSYAMTDLSAKTTGIVPGTPGNIIIRALGKDNVFDSDFSVAKSYTAKMYAPTNIFYDKTNFMIMWDKVAGTSTDIAVDKYAITVKTYVGGVLSIYNSIDGAKTKTNSHTLPSALPDGSYVIEVVTIGNGFINSDPAISAISVQLDKVITFVVDEDTNKSFTVNCGLNNTLKRPADPTKPHNVFVGWKYYNGTSMVDFKFEGEAGAINVAENYTITAQWKKIVTEIKVTTLPTNLVYYIGDQLKLDGGKVTVYYEDGTAQEMVFTTNDFIIPASVGEIGFKEMTISYKNAGYIPHEHGLLDTSLATTFYVEVKIRYIASIAVTTPITKLIYAPNEALDFTAGKVTITYDDGGTKIVDINETNFIITPTAAGTTIGAQTITLKLKDAGYNLATEGKLDSTITTTFDITVETPPAP